MREFWFGNGVETLPSEWLGAYDIVVATGCFLVGHVPCTGFDDAHAMCKVGGYLVSSIRKTYYENGHELGMKDKLDELVAAGKFELVNTWMFMRGIADVPDPIFTQMESLMFVYRRIA